MKYRPLESFRNDFRRLPAEHQQMFLQVLREFFLPAIECRVVQRRSSLAQAAADPPAEQHRDLLADLELRVP